MCLSTDWLLCDTCGSAKIKPKEKRAAWKTFDDDLKDRAKRVKEDEEIDDKEKTKKFKAIDAASAA